MILRWQTASPALGHVQREAGWGFFCWVFNSRGCLTQTLFPNTTRSTHGHRTLFKFPGRFYNHFHNLLTIRVLLSDTLPLISAQLQESESEVGCRNMFVTFYTVIANRTEEHPSSFHSYEAKKPQLPSQRC